MIDYFHVSRSEFFDQAKIIGREKEIEEDVFKRKGTQRYSEVQIVVAKD